MNKEILIEALEKHKEEAMQLNGLDEYDDYIMGMNEIISYIEGAYEDIVNLNTPIEEIIAQMR